MKPTKAQRAEIGRFVQKWRSVLYLHKWNFDVCYMKNDDCGKSAEIVHTPHYFEGEIRIFPLFWNEKDPKKREEVIVHELVHAILGPLDHNFHQLHKGRHVDLNSHHDMVERVTQHVTNIVFHR